MSVQSDQALYCWLVIFKYSPSYPKNDNGKFQGGPSPCKQFDRLRVKNQVITVYYYFFMDIENNRLVPWMEVYLARWRNLLGEPQANMIISGAEPDKLFPFSGTDPIILFILLLNFCHRFSIGMFRIYIYYRLFIQK